MSRNNRTALSAFCCCVMTASFWRWSSPNLLCFSSSVDLRAMMRFLARSCSALTRSGDCTMRCDNFSPSAWAARMLTFSWSWNWKTCSRITFCFPPPPPLHLPHLEFPPKGTLDGVPQQNQLRQLHYSSSPRKAPLTVVSPQESQCDSYIHLGKTLLPLHSPSRASMSYVPLGKPLLPLISPRKATLTATFLLAAEIAVTLPLGNLLLWLFFPGTGSVTAAVPFFPGESQLWQSHILILRHLVFFDGMNNRIVRKV